MFILLAKFNAVRLAIFDFCPPAFLTERGTAFFADFMLVYPQNPAGFDFPRERERARNLVFAKRLKIGRGLQIIFGIKGGRGFDVQNPEFAVNRRERVHRAGVAVSGGPNLLLDKFRMKKYSA